MTTYDIFDNTSRASLLQQGACIEQLRAVLLKVGLWVGEGDTQTLELTNDANLSLFVLDDHVAWASILLCSSSALDNGAAFRRRAVRNPSFDDDVSCKGTKRVRR